VTVVEFGDIAVAFVESVVVYYHQFDVSVVEVAVFSIEFGVNSI